MEVHILFEDSEYTSVIGVFEKEDDAISIKNQLSEQYENEHNHYYIETHTIE
ncbi:MAG: hypothetical protein WA061_01850 [Microgenomates group bacterium]